MNINDFGELLAWVKNNKLASIETITIDLATARNNLLLEISGLVIYASDASDNSCNLQIQHNEQSNGLITITKNYGVEFPFYRLYLTNTAQANKTITLIIGRAAPFSITDNRSTLDILTTLQTIRGQRIAETGSLNAEATIGTAQVTALNANANRKSFSIQAKDTNTGIVYVAYYTGVDTTHYKFILQAGQAFSDDTWKGAVYVYGSAAGQLICGQEETA